MSTHSHLGGEIREFSLIDKVKTYIPQCGACQRGHCYAISRVAGFVSSCLWHF